jgi:hypothetical protein
MVLSGIAVTILPDKEAKRLIRRKNDGNVPIA